MRKRKRQTVSFGRSSIFCGVELGGCAAERRRHHGAYRRAVDQARLVCFPAPRTSRRWLPQRLLRSAGSPIGHRFPLSVHSPGTKILDECKKRTRFAAPIPNTHADLRRQYPIPRVSWERPKLDNTRYPIPGRRFAAPIPNTHQYGVRFVAPISGPARGGASQRHVRGQNRGFAYPSGGKYLPLGGKQI